MDEADLRSEEKAGGGNGDGGAEGRHFVTRNLRLLLRAAAERVGSEHFGYIHLSLVPLGVNAIQDLRMHTANTPRRLLEGGGLWVLADFQPDPAPAGAEGRLSSLDMRASLGELAQWRWRGVSMEQSRSGVQKGTSLFFFAAGWQVT